MAELFGIGELLPDNALWLDLLADMFCDPGPTQVICTTILFIGCGFNQEQINETLLPTILNHTPSGASTKDFFHYLQMVTSAEFHKYDFGPEQNMQIYGQTTPPLYSVEKVDLPVATYWGPNDWLTAEEVFRVKILQKNAINKFVFRTTPGWWFSSLI